MECERIECGNCQYYLVHDEQINFYPYDHLCCKIKSLGINEERPTAFLIKRMINSDQQPILRLILL